MYEHVQDVIKDLHKRSDADSFSTLYEVISGLSRSLRRRQKRMLNFSNGKETVIMSWLRQNGSDTECLWVARVQRCMTGIPPRSGIPAVISRKRL